MRTRVGVLALTILVSAGCGKIKEVSSDGAPESDATPEFDAAPPGPCDPGGEPTFDEAYDCLIQAGCELVTHCFIPYTVEQCKTLDLELFDLDVRLHREVVRQGIEQGTVVFHPEVVADCYAAITGKECPFLFEHGNDSFDFGDLCPVFEGTVASEGVCFTASECELAGSECLLGACENAACCPGTCVAPAADNESCDGRPCGAGSYCVAGLCRPGVESSPCSDTGDCDEGLWCDGEICQPELESGASCVVFESCPGPEVCLVPPGSKSGTCARIDQPDAPCNDQCMGLQCDQPNPSELGSCVPYITEEGEDCSVLSCGLSFECDRGADQCVPKGEVGAECLDSFDDCVPGLFCDNEITGPGTGHCTARLAAGETCADDDHCHSDFCDDTGDPVCAPIPDCWVQ